LQRVLFYWELKNLTNLSLKVIYDTLCYVSRRSMHTVRLCFLIICKKHLNHATPENTANRYFITIRQRIRGCSDSCG